MRRRDFTAGLLLAVGDQEEFFMHVAGSLPENEAELAIYQERTASRCSRTICRRGCVPEPRPRLTTRRIRNKIILLLSDTR